MIRTTYIAQAFCVAMALISLVCGTLTVVAGHAVGYVHFINLATFVILFFSLRNSRRSLQESERMAKKTRELTERLRREYN